jgi:hypothetical protein
MKRIAISIFIIVIFLFSNLFSFSPRLVWAQGAGLVAYWKFDEGSGIVASDSSGNGNAGTLRNGPQWVDGVSGKALKFDGVDDFVYVPHSSSLDIVGNQMTVEYWMKLSVDWEPGMNTNMIIYDKGDAYVGSMIGSSGAHRFNLPYKTPYPETNKNSWTAGVWYHIADIYDGSYIRIYVNGVLDKAEPISGPIPRSTINLAIGAHCLQAWPFYFNGIIDEFAIYNRAKTPEEIKADYDRFALTLTHTVLELPAGAWYPGELTPNTILQSINVAGQGQVAVVGPGQTISVSYSMQIFANPTAPAEIRQAFFGYSWASSWPPWDAYTEIYNGMPGLYPGVTKTGTFNIKVPTIPGEYNVWLLGGSAYRMRDAVAAHTSPPTVLPHAIIIVQAPRAPEFEVIILTVEDEVETGPSFFKGQRLVALPAGETKKLKVRAQLKSSDEVLNGKRVKLLIDNTPVSENMSRETFDVAAYVSLTYGLHEGRLVFDGDDKYPSCSAKFTILAYKSSGFQVEKDGYSFVSWGMTLTDFLEFVNSDPELRILGPFAPLIYLLLSLRGHCFGMAYTSSLYYTGGLAKPRADATTYSLAQSEADDNIRRHHIAQVPFLLGIYPSESVAGLKRLIDEGTPPVIAYDMHAITGIGYAEVGDDFYLIAYDNNFPAWYRIYRVDLNAGRIGEYDLLNFTSDLAQSSPTFHEILLVIRPVPILSELISGLMKSVRRNIGIIIHSNVDIKITSTDGGVMQIIGGETLRNDFGESQVYLSDEAKIFLLPANAAYDVELTCRENGIVSITCSVPKGDSLVGTQFNDVTLSTNSKITFTVKPGAKTGSIGIDNNGDGNADSNISPDKTYSWSEKGMKEVLLEIFGLELGLIDIIMVIGVASLAILVAIIASIFPRRRQQKLARAIGSP